jgi:hypothetical protein
MQVAKWNRVKKPTPKVKQQFHIARDHALEMKMKTKMMIGDIGIGDIGSDGISESPPHPFPFHSTCSFPVSSTRSSAVAQQQRQKRSSKPTPQCGPTTIIIAVTTVIT